MFVMVTCAGHKDSVTCVGFNHNSSLVVTGDMAGLIKVWSVDCCQEVWSYEVDDLEASSLPSLAGHTHTHTQAGTWLTQVYLGDSHYTV